MPPRTFMIMLRSTEVQGDNPIELLQLVLADDTDPKAAISSPMEAMSETRRAALCEIMRRRIDVRSRGLLEIHGRSSISIVGRSVVTDYVEFLHRTVVDFLRTVEMWELLSSLAGASFDPHLSLLSSCLMEAKILPIESRFAFQFRFGYSKHETSFCLRQSFGGQETSLHVQIYSTN